MRLATILMLLLLAPVLTAQATSWVKAVDGSLSRTGHTLTQFNGRIWSMGGRAACAGAPSTPGGPLTSEIWSTADGVTWTMESPSAAWSAREGHAAAEFNGRMWVIGGEADVWSSGDGVSWRRDSGNPGWGARKWHTCAAMNGKLWVMGGSEAGTDTADVWSSTDGCNWTLVTPMAPWPARSRHASIVFNGRLWVMGGGSATATYRDVWSSSDGLNWTQDAATAGWGARVRHTAITHAGRMYVLGGKLSGLASVADVWSSPDGASWVKDCQMASWGLRSCAGCMVLNNELWVIGGAGVDDVGFTDAWSSTDGSSWTRRGPQIGLAPARFYEATCVFNGRFWKVGGNSLGNTMHNDVWSSQDGVNWTQVLETGPFSVRSSSRLEVLNGRMYLLGGESNYLQIKGDVWSTADGVNWIQESTHTWPALPGTPGYGGRCNHFSTVFNGRIWVMGGITNLYDYSPDVWSTGDGVNWTLEGSGFPQDIGCAQLMTFNGAMWLFGGDIYGANVWSSTDGVAWNLHTSTAPWGQRVYHAAAVHAGRMWMIGGNYASYYNDLWSTADGVNWVQETPSAAFTPARSNAGAGVLNGRILLHGGWDGNQTSYDRSQDSWYYVDNGVAPQFTSTPAGLGIAGVAYSYTPAFTGTPAPKLTLSGPVPAWLEVNAGTGELHGTPAMADVGTTPTIILTVSNAFGSDTQSFQISVLGPAPQITSTPMSTAIVSQPYSYSVVAVGGPPAPAISAAGLPAWLGFDPVTGVLAGTPGVAEIGTFPTITLTASNGTQPDAVQSFQITVQGTAAAISSMPITTVHVGSEYTYTVTATGLPAPALSASNLPAWLTFDPATGTLAGRPGLSAIGTWNIEIWASTGWGPDAVQQFAIEVPDPLQKGGSANAGGCANGDGNQAWCATLAMLVAIVSARRLRRRV